MNMLSRRLAKIETALMPVPARPVVLLAAPPECANEAMREVLQLYAGFEGNRRELREGIVNLAAALISAQRPVLGA